MASVGANFMPVKRRSVNRYFPRDLSRFFCGFDNAIAKLEAMVASRMGKSQRLNLSQRLKPLRLNTLGTDTQAKP
jgi:hypothetical protein